MLIRNTLGLWHVALVGMHIEALLRRPGHEVRSRVGKDCQERTSCLGGCGQFEYFSVGDNHSCACDSDCNLFGDCCRDFSTLCEEGITPSFLHHHGEIQCFSTEESHYGQYVVSKCPSTYPLATNVGLLCDISQPNRDTIVYFNGVWYKNEDCQKCWIDEQSTALLSKLRISNRSCIPDLQACSVSGNNNALQRQDCQDYLLPIVFDGNSTSTGSTKYYRNPNCLICEVGSENQTVWDHVTCFDPQMEVMRDDFSGLSEPQLSHPKSAEHDSANMLYDSIKRNCFAFDLPHSIAILINFGYDDKHIMYSADNWIHGCQDDELWDPFSEVCREIYCDSNLDLVEFECIGDTYGNYTETYQPIMLPSSPVLLNLTSLVTPVRNKSTDIPVIKRHIECNFAETFADYFYISQERIQNVTVDFVQQRNLSSSQEIMDELMNARDYLNDANASSNEDILNFQEMRQVFYTLDKEKDVYEFQIVFILMEREGNETVEDSTDSVVAYMAEFISENSFQMFMRQPEPDLTLQITAMHETTFYTEDEIYTWCRGGLLNTYTHDELNITMRVEGEESNSGYSDWSMHIRVLESGEEYGPGEFVANLMFQGVYNDDIANFTGVVKVCENRAHLNDSRCPRIILGFDQFEFAEDCSDVAINYTGSSKFDIESPLYGWEYTVKEDGVEICIWVPPFILADPVEAWISFITLLVSLTCLGLTLLTYCIFFQLRNLPGLNLMALAFTTFSYQLIFVTLVNTETAYKRTLCKIVAIVEHFLILASFLWTNVMAWDIYQTFGKKTLFTQVRSKRYFWKYLIYVYGVDFLIISFAVMIEYSDLIDGFEMGYGNYGCWIGNTSASLIFIAVPLGVVLLFNAYLYIKTIISINYVSKLVRGFKNKKSGGRKDLFLYVRLLAILGFTWIFGMLTIFIPYDAEGWSYSLLRILVYLHIIFCGLQGLFIFSVFTLNSRVFNLYKNLIHSMKVKLSRNDTEVDSIKDEASACDCHWHKTLELSSYQHWPQGLRAESLKYAADTWIVCPMGKRLKNRVASDQSRPSDLTTTTSLGSLENPIKTAALVGDEKDDKDVCGQTNDTKEQ